MVEAIALYRRSAILPRAATWYAKRVATFSDVFLRSSRTDGEVEKVPRTVLDRMADLACYAA